MRYTTSKILVEWKYAKLLQLSEIAKHHFSWMRYKKSVLIKQIYTKVVIIKWYCTEQDISWMRYKNWIKIAWNHTY